MILQEFQLLVREVDPRLVNDIQLWKPWREEEEPDGELYLGNFVPVAECGWDDLTARPYLIPSIMLWGDYIGGDVERSNARSFWRDFQEVLGVHKVHGHPGVEGIAITPEAWESDERIPELFKALADYPLLDEEDHSELELELQGEDWESYRCYETRSWIEANLDEDDEEDAELLEYVAQLSDDDLFRLHHDAMEQENVYYEIETGCNVYVPDWEERVLPRVVAMLPEWRQKEAREAQLEAGQQEMEV